MNYSVAFPTMEMQTFRVTPTILKVILWVSGMWAWATLLELAPDALDVAILLLTAGPAVYLFWKRPAYGIIALMFFAHAVLAPNIVDIRLPLLGGFELRDILLLLMFGLSLFKSLARGFLRIAWWPVGGLLLAFFAMMFFSVIYALFFERVAGNWVLGDARILSYYLIFFITAWNVTTKETLYVLVIGCFVIADITAAIILMQQYLGPYNYLLSSMHDSSWQIWQVAGSTRVVPPGIVFMYFMMLISLGLTIFWQVGFKRTLFWIFQTGFLSLGLLFTFTRSAWVASAISLGLMLIIMFPIYRPYLAAIIVLGGATVLFLVGVIGLFLNDSLAVENSAVGAITDRFVSIFTVEDTLETNSLQWRYFEIQEATKAIQESPWIGVGLGNVYRPLTVFQGEARGDWTDGNISSLLIGRFTRYVHSSYYAMAVKMGLPALAIFLSFYIAAILKSLSMYYQLSTGMAKGLSLAIGMAMVGLMQWSLLHAHFMLVSSTAAIGLMLGLLASVHYLYFNRSHGTLRMKL